MVYVEMEPPTSLSGLVSAFWGFQLSAGSAPLQHTVPPDGCVNLCWVFPGRAVVVGPRVDALRVSVQAGFQYRGARLLPGAAEGLLGLKAADIRGQSFLFNGVGEDFEDELLRRAVTAPPLDPVISEMTRRIIEADGRISVAELTDGLDISYRQALRRFVAAAGLTRKEFARIRRLRAACWQAIASAEPEWAGVSADRGFADQSHMAREFRDVYGWPPRLVHEYLRRIDHRMVSA